MRVRRQLGVPDWMTPLASEATPSLTVPAIEIEDLTMVHERDGAAGKVESVCTLSGQRWCVIAYRGRKRTLMLALAKPEFMRLWENLDEARERLRIACGEPAELNLWLENARTPIDDVDGEGHCWVLRQRNGRLRVERAQEAPEPTH